MNRKLMIVTPALCLLAAAPIASAQSGSTSTSSHNTAASVGTAVNHRNDAHAVEELQAAAQRLRDAIQAMAQAPAGEKRNDAIRAGNEALATTQAAMANLPSDLLIAGATETDYRKAMDRLKQAADRLREATHALAKEPAGERRNAAIRKANQALLDTQQAMIEVPMRVSSR